MLLVEEPEELRATLETLRCAGRRVGFVPTMGALHEGHLSLVRAARADCDVVVVSIFVNPLQFGAGEDLDRYPRQLEADLALLEPLAADVVFHPAAERFTPPGRLTSVRVAGITEVLEGAARPGHFDGVSTIVTKLFNAVGPCRAYFGEKDFQQLAVVRRMAADLNQPVEVIGCPIVRDADGLALSSRNVYLSPEQRRDALALSAALREVAGKWRGDAGWARTYLANTLGDAPNVRLDYAEVVDPVTLEPLEGVVRGEARALVAAYVGDTRLIDNIRLEPPTGA
ncbi:MAG TPA: pantoate--beta-alanine ligase [Egibacteraceae bacterium]|nr:pantoate--beta-alanine ligase [Egibacteraceae bacterium]